MFGPDPNWRPLAYVAARDRSIRSGIAGALREEGWAVIESLTGYHLLQTFSEPFDGLLWRTPDLVVADAYSVDCAGVRLATELRDIGWSAPFVLLTHSALERARLSDEPERAIFGADSALGIPTVQEIARHRLRILTWTPDEPKEGLLRKIYGTTTLSS